MFAASQLNDGALVTSSVAAVSDEPMSLWSSRRRRSHSLSCKVIPSSARLIRIVGHAVSVVGTRRVSLADYLNNSVLDADRFAAS